MSVASISLTGLSASDIVPGAYVGITWAAGAASSGSGTYSALLMGNKTSAGSATVDSQVYGPDTLTPCSTEADVIALFGTGSELHRMWLRFVAVNKTTPVYLLAVTESAGTNATGALTFVNTATGIATARIWVGDDFCDVPINVGDTPTVIAAAAAVIINAKTQWAVTATSSAGVVTLTSRQKGPRGNSIKISAQILQGSPATTVSPTVPTALTSGATADVWTNAITTAALKRYYYIVTAAEDATNIGAVSTMVTANSAPTTGIRERLFFGSIDTLGNLITLSTAINAVRAEVAWLNGADWTPAELASQEAAVIAAFEAPAKPRLNFNSFGADANTASYWRLKAPRNGAAPTRAQILSALNNGITPIGVSGGSTYLVKRVTTYSLNGAVNDYRIRDGHKVTVLDRYADDLQAKASLQLAGKSIGDDVVPGQRQPGGDVVTPMVVKALVNRLTRDYDENDMLQNVSVILANTVVQREASPRSRMSARIPLQAIDILDQSVFALDQV